MTLDAHVYATTDQVYEHMSDPEEVAPADLVERAINSATRWVNRHCGRRFWQDATAQTRYYRVHDDEVAWVDDISTTTGLIVATDSLDNGTYDVTWESTDYELEPENADADGGAYAWWRILSVGDLLFPLGGRRRRLSVTARFGWSEVPQDIEQATIMRAAALVKRRDTIEGIAGFEGFGMRTTKSDPDIKALLDPYVRVWVGAV